MEQHWNKLGGNEAIHSFEKKWCGWDINDTIKWFDFVLKFNDQNDDDNDCEIEYYSSEDDDDDENSSDNDDDVKQHEMANIDNDASINNDYSLIKQVLESINFRPRKDFPLIVKPFQFE